MLSPDEARSMFDYDAASGELRWQHDRGRNKTAGQLAGCRRSDGYCVVRIGGRSYLIHRVVWALVHGEWPPALIDHIDMDPSNNRISNLRVATHSQNKANRGANANNTSGFKGVCYSKRLRDRAKPWRAMIKIDGELKNLGSFATPEQAHVAYEAAARAAFGEFARAA